MRDQEQVIQEALDGRGSAEVEHMDPVLLRQPKLSSQCPGV